ncbi:hypothetical protein HA41_00435 [Pantoea conspicua]|uniref:Uncharacterized protein n=1 Tax=Pantoea conspicua TaxID=472705 RepID=A0A1X1C2N8_9GAMM|nr:hypothetical protein [Pantoea conspicua]ORM55933.1 hypothetical protein HA41_00435 [Pantoea conspicua]
MSNYYVSGCVADGDDVSTCDDSVAQFWTLYHRNEEGLSEGIIDCMFREDAEAAMRVYKERDALAALTAPPVKLPNKEHIFPGCDTQQMTILLTHNAAIDGCAEAIRAAGYKVEGG